MKTITQQTSCGSGVLGFRILSMLGSLLVALGWLSAGCVPIAVQPFYAEKDVVNDPALLGSWKDKADPKQRWTFTQGPGKSYLLEIQSDDKEASFVAHLFKMGEARFLDLYPTKAGLEEKLEKNPYGGSLIPGHLVIRVRAINKALQMSCMSLEWLTEELKKNRSAIDHVVVPDGRVVLTVGTDALQEFIRKHLKETAAWNEMYEEGLVKVD